MYAMLGTHPDISFSVTIVSKFSGNPGIVHWEAVKQIYWYLISSKDLWLSYGGGEKELVGFADADGSMAKDQHVTSVICLGCNKDLWSWRSKYKSYGAEGVRSGGKGLSPGVLWQVETVGLWQCNEM